MASIEEIRRISILASTQGVDAAKVSLDQLAASQAKVATTASGMATSTDNASKSVLSAASKVESLRRANDSAYASQKKLEAGQRSVLSAVNQGAISSDMAAKTLAALESRYGGVAGAAAGAARAHIEHTAALGLSRMQMLESAHVVKALADSIIATGRPLQALAMEGGRIAEIFASGSGGVGGTLKAMGGIVGGLLTGWVGLGVGIAGALALAGGAVLRFQSQQDKLAVSLNGVGRAAGVTLGGLTAMANNSAATTPGMSQGAATGLAAGFAHAGLSGGVIQGALGATKSYSNATGQDLASSGAELAKALSDPVKGAEELSSKLGFLDGTTRQLIESMTRSGDVLGAQRLLLDRVGESTKNATDRAYWFTKAWESAAGAVGQAVDKVGRIGQAAPLEDQRASVAGQLQTEQSAWGPFRTEGQIAHLTDVLAKLDDAIREQNKQIAADAHDQQAQKLSLQATGAVRAIDPYGSKQQELTDAIALLTKTLIDPDAAARVPGGAGALSRARNMYVTEQANADPMQRLAQDSALQIQSIQAVTLAQKEAVEARQAELSVLRQSNDAILAAAAAEAKRNEILAQSQKEIDDLTRSAGRNLSHVGMTPSQRRIAEINERYDDAERRLGNGGVRISAPTPSSYSAPVTTAPVDARAALKSQIDVLGQGLTKADLSGDSTAIAAYTREIIIAAQQLKQMGDVKSKPAAVMAAHLAPANSNTTARINTLAGARAIDIGAARKEDQVGPILEANKALDAQNALLSIQENAGNRSAAAVQGLLEKQRLLNQYIKDGVTPTKATAEALDAYAAKATAAAQAQEALQQKIQAFDAIRADANEGLHTFVDDLVSGKNAAFALRDAMEQLGKKLLSAGLDQITSGLFGKQGTTQTGILGGILGSLFHFADGGIMTSSGPIPLRRYADGGVASSPQAAVFGEGSGPEAFIPLKGGAVPVKVSGGGRGGNITNHIAGHTVVVQGNADEKAIASLRAELAQAQKDQMTALQRNMGQMQGRWGQRYGT